MIKILGLEHLTASRQPEVLGGLLDVSEGRLRGCFDYLKYLKTTSQVLNTCRTQLRRARGLVRPGATGLLISVEYCGVRNSTWNTPFYLVSTRTAVELAEVQGNYLTYSE